MAWEEGVKRVGLWLVIAGVAGIALDFLVGMTILAAMMAELIPHGGPPAFIWIGLITSAWVAAIGATICFVCHWRGL